MLEYRLDDLHWAEFEQLCQALLKATLGVGVEAWGGSGDWGNDAYCQAPLCYPGSDLQEGPFQFQVKFVQGANAAGAKPRAPLITAVKRECQRIKKRNQPAPRVYSLLTNVILSVELRKTVEGLIRKALPGCSMIVLHGGNDLCSWLHLNGDVARMFPQLLSHRDLSELVRQSLQGTSDKATPPQAKPLSALLKSKTEQARAASRKRDINSALRLWEEVRQQAEEEDNKAEELGARLETVLILVRDEGYLSEALKLADTCLQEAKTVDLSAVRSRLLQLLGEVHRIKGNVDQARGFLTSALEHARSNSSSLDEGFALLSLSALEKPRRGRGDSGKALEFVDLAYNAFSAAYASGDDKQQEGARDGFAQCHCWRAEIFDYSRPDDALVEWNRALEAFQQLGHSWEWLVADTLLHRSDLRARIGERKLAVTDLDGAAKIFSQIGDTVGLAKCHLQAGELLDLSGQRTKAAEQYKQACAIAATWSNDRRASYFYFRYACKLAELREYEDAEQILTFLANAEWLERKIKLTVITQLCLTARAMENDEKLKERCSLVLALIDEALDEAVSAEERRSLLIQKGQHLEQLDQHEQALQYFHKAAGRFEAVNDKTGIVECWFHIRGVMQKLGDRQGEREASDKVLALGGEKLAPMFAALALVGLAQLNINEQRYTEASAQLDRAKELDPDNPVVNMIEADLRSKLPQFSPVSLQDARDASRPSQRDMPTLIRELHEWCASYPDKRNAILAVWYYVHRKDLWSTLRSMLGVKFLICSIEVAQFKQIRRRLQGHGDLFVWGTNFSLKTKPAKTPAGLEQVPVPEWFLFPAGTKFLTPRPANGRSSTKGVTDGEHRLLRPLENLPAEPYYLVAMENPADPLGASPFFVGRKQAWSDMKIVKFMLGPPPRDLATDQSICLPLSERGVIPNLKRVIEVASENGAVPVFPSHLPHSDEISATCDSMLELPTDADSYIPAKDLWAQLLLSCSDSPRPALANFTKGMTALLRTQPQDRLPVRVYLLRFQAGTREIIHPAVVVPKAAQLQKRS